MNWVRTTRRCAALPPTRELVVICMLSAVSVDRDICPTVLDLARQRYAEISHQWTWDPGAPRHQTLHHATPTRGVPPWSPINQLLLCETVRDTRGLPKRSLGQDTPRAQTGGL